MKNLLGQILSEMGITVREASQRVGVKPQTIYRHIKGTRSVSPEMALLYERRLGISRSRLRPDLWPVAATK